MRITGHKLLGAYSRYDRSVDAQVRVAGRCAIGATKGSLSNDTTTTVLGPIIIDFDDQLEMEDRKGKEKTFKGIEVKANQKLVQANKVNAEENEDKKHMIEGNNAKWWAELADDWLDEVDWDEHFENLSPRAVVSSVTNNPIAVVWKLAVIEQLSDYHYNGQSQ